LLGLFPSISITLSAAVYNCVKPLSFTGSGFILSEGRIMETRIAVMGIIVEDTGSVEALNSLLHEYGSYIIGRMGLPYRQRNLNIMSIAIDAPQDTISALAGKIGNLKGISVKTAYSNVGGK
jgi:putative iron-only hydrogenase system regulator